MLRNNITNNRYNSNITVKNIHQVKNMYNIEDIKIRLSY